MTQPRRPENLALPAGLTEDGAAWPVLFLDGGGFDFGRSDATKAVNASLHEALCAVHGGPVTGQALLKVHIGEPDCTTRMRPAYAAGAVAFLRERGAAGAAAGDSTVAYTGHRGYRENADEGAAAYLQLARQHGWARRGPARLPFVVLDKPATSVPGVFTFKARTRRRELRGVNRFGDFFLAGGFAAADFVVNYAHLTLHGLAGVAGCVKSIAMGCSGLKGKLRMHQALLPTFDAEACTACGSCVDNCPENALELGPDDASPSVKPARCIGCGECEAVCANGAVAVRGHDISDWERGRSTVSLRMADYLLGLMQDKWANVVHVLHMTRITERCDCVNRRQEPLLSRDLGFLIGKNPFAVDRTAARLLARALNDEGRKVDAHLLRTAEVTGTYVSEEYGILHEVPVHRCVLRAG
ncbi:MAG: DUF362 domain-containing protein [Kiritimatiellae bacterium]|nr:DUF362 domain-containing protein [Kiritimatiellia bacterium]